MVLVAHTISVHWAG